MAGDDEHTGSNHPTGHAPWAPRGCDPGVSFFPGVSSSTALSLPRRQPERDHRRREVTEFASTEQETDRRSWLDVAGLAARTSCPSGQGPGDRRRALLLPLLPSGGRPARALWHIRWRTSRHSEASAELDVAPGSVQAARLQMPACAERVSSVGRRWPTDRRLRHGHDSGSRATTSATRRCFVTGDTVWSLRPGRHATATPSKTLAVVFPYRRANAELEPVADAAFTIKAASYARHQLPVA